MRWIVRNLAIGLGVALALVATSSTSRAGMLVGSFSLAGFTVTSNGANLSVSTMISAASTLTSGPGTKDYSPIPVGTNFGPNTVDLTNLKAFTFSNASFGSFATSSGLVVQQTQNFLDIFLDGTFTPGPSLSGFDPTLSSVRISINQSGTSLSEGITLTSPPLTRPDPAPEPASLIALGIGALGVLGYGWQRRYRRLRKLAVA
jgi:hypothetical protein